MNDIEKYIEKKLNYNINYDVVKRKVNNMTYYFLSSLADIDLVNKVIEGDILKKDFILNASIDSLNDIDLAINNVLSGCLLLLMNNKIYVIETRNYPTRGISESESEKSLKGSHDGFNESIIVNTALLRRRIKDENFRCEILKVGNKSKTDITINYIEGKANNDLLKKIKRKLSKLNVDNLSMSDKTLVELLFHVKFQVFPKVRYSERPDVASIHILKGYIVLLVDTSSSCIIIPTTFFELNEQLQEYQLPPLISTFNRLFRFFCVLIGLYLMPLWFLYCIDKNPPNNAFLIIDNIDKNTLFIQVISVLIFLNAIRIASYNSTSLLSTSMSILATIILSDLAVKTGLLSSEVVFYGALSSICSFAISNYETSRAVSFWNFVLIIAVGLFNKIGFIIFSTILFISLVVIHSFDVYYLYPFIPFDFTKLIKRIFKVSS